MTTQSFRLKTVSGSLRRICSAFYAVGKDWPSIPGAGGFLLEYSDKIQIIAVGVSSQVVDLAARGLPVGLGADAGVDYCFLVHFNLCFCWHWFVSWFIRCSNNKRTRIIIEPISGYSHFVLAPVIEHQGRRWADLFTTAGDCSDNGGF